jgi:branched-chain amino acid transport system ATP-binding protein
MLEARDLQAYYGLSHILFGVCLTVNQGEVVALLGRNGAGKTTTLKTIMGIVTPKSGSVTFRGERLSGLRPYEICQRGIGFVPEDRRIFKYLTVRENLEVGRRRPRDGRERWSLDRVFELFPVLKQFERRLAGTLSGGEQQMLTIARSLMGNPQLLLLDEPSEGLAPVVVQSLAQQIVELRREGLTIILSEQNLKFATYLSDRAYIIEKGQIKYEGTIADLQANPDVRRAYLMV